MIMNNPLHLTAEALEAGLANIRQSPRDVGVVKLIVRRPQTGERETLETGELTCEAGLVGDNWRERNNNRPSDSPVNCDRQLTVMNARAVALLAQTKERWPLAGDQFYVDLDLSAENLSAGSRLSIGSALIEVTLPPHNGCRKFSERFGQEAMAFVNSPVGKQLHLRGINARVIQPGIVCVGDLVRKV